MNTKLLIGLALAGVFAVPAFLFGLLMTVNMTLVYPGGRYAALAGGGLFAAAAVLGSLWADRKPVRIFRRSLIVLALLALLAGTGFLAVAWLVVGTGQTGRPYGPGAWVGAYSTGRAISLLIIWPPTVFVAWLLGTAALLARRRFASAAVYTASAFAALGAVYAIVVLAPLIPLFTPANLLTAPAWIDALLFLALDAAAVYLAWTTVFSTDFVQPAMRGTT